MSALTDILRELAQPELKPAPAPIRRGPVYSFTYGIEDMDGWALDIDYRYDRDSDEDAWDVEIVDLGLYTPAGRIALDTDALAPAVRERVEDAIRDEIDARLEAQGDWLRDEGLRGEYEMEAARDRRMLRDEE